MIGNQNLLSTFYVKFETCNFISFRETIILENPLSEFNNESVDEIFRKICGQLIEMGKTVIVVSQNDNVI